MANVWYRDKRGVIYHPTHVLVTKHPATHEYETAAGSRVTEEMVRRAQAGFFVARTDVVAINKSVKENQMYHEGNLCGLDFETYGSRPLPDVGLENYVRDSHFTALIARVAKRGPRINSRMLGKLSLDRFCFVEGDRQQAIEELRQAIGDRFIVAHNAPFEKRVLATLGLHYPSDRFVDSAVVARAAGAAGKLEAAAPQLLGIDKMEEGKNLIRLFSIPGKYQEKHETLAFHEEVIADHLHEWGLFGQYCDVDATCGLDIVLDWGWVLTKEEPRYNAITTDMVELGWKVDIDLVKEMQRRYEENLAVALEQFHDKFPDPFNDGSKLNFNSLKQLKEFCANRGIKATSFDEKHVEKLLARIEAKLESMVDSDVRYENYCDVRYMLRTKQILGGSSLKKLKVILNNVDADSRLRDQYLHIGAGQTWRTSGRSVQMQNLKRFKGEPADMSELYDQENIWSNEELAANLRQAFTATHPNGELLVGDFSSVEGRGLAYLAGETWKELAFSQGKDLYKVLAASPEMFGVPYDSVTKDQRQLGKVGELSCGYNAGGPAVQAFASKMGTELSEAEAASLVTKWRAANPKIVQFWWDLDEMLHDVVEGRRSWVEKRLPHDDLVLKFSAIAAPDSLRKQAGDSLRTLVIELIQRDDLVLRRFFHGVHVRGRNIGYFKPSEVKSGDLWRNWYINPKTKQREFFTIYGGKLTGILTQSFCREIFFRVLSRLRGWVDIYPNLRIVGQFHDEIVVDWEPPSGQSPTLDVAMQRMTQYMSEAAAIGFLRFPLAAEVKHDYRYTK